MDTLGITAARRQLSTARPQAVPRAEAAAIARHDRPPAGPVHISPGLTTTRSLKREKLSMANSHRGPELVEGRAAGGLAGTPRRRGGARYPPASTPTRKHVRAERYGRRREHQRQEDQHG